VRGAGRGGNSSGEGNGGLSCGLRASYELFRSIVEKAPDGEPWPNFFTTPTARAALHTLDSLQSTQPLRPGIRSVLSEFGRTCASPPTIDHFGDFRTAQRGYIVLLNKTDLFKEQLKKSRLSNLFHDYKGADGDYDAALAFVRGKFEQCVERFVKARPRTVSDHPVRCYVFPVCLSGESNIDTVCDDIFEAVKSHVFQVNLEKLGMSPY